MLIRLSLLLIFFSSLNVSAKISVFTTTTNLASLVELIGKDKVKVESLCKGTQDPHFLEAKPSYTFKLSKADLLVSIGAGLEDAWLDLVVRGSRNPKIRVGNSRRLVSSDHLKLEEQVVSELSRADGDVHPEGNPHFMLSPKAALKVSKVIKEKLIEINSSEKDYYEKNYKEFLNSLNHKVGKWKKLVTSNLKVITYHKTLTYFYKDFGVENIDVLEPKPGIPPSASHILKLIKKIKSERVKKIIIENYFDDSVARKIKESVPNIKIITVPVAVHGNKKVKDLIELYDHLVKSIGM